MLCTVPGRPTTALMALPYSNKTSSSSSTSSSSRWRGLFAMTSVTKTERESDFGTSQTEKRLRGVEKSPSDVGTTRESRRLRRKETISRKGTSIGNQKWKGVEEDAKKRPCRRECRSNAFRNRSIARIFENGASQAFSARLDDRKRFVASNDRSRKFEGSETTPESVEKRRFSKGTPTRKERGTTRRPFRRVGSRRERRRATKSEGGVGTNGSMTSSSKMARTLIVVGFRGADDGRCSPCCHHAELASQASPFSVDQGEGTCLRG